MSQKKHDSTHVLLTVIYPFLNASEDVKPCFEGLRDQTDIRKAQIEIIIVNDGSTDNTESTINENRALLNDYRNVRVITHPERLGLTQTRLDGATAAKGTHITFLDKKCRPDHDYLSSFFIKNRNIIIGNPYMKKTRSAWGRALALIRQKLYYPYFNHDFKDIELDAEAYRKFKNKGGGGAMFVKRSYYLEVAAHMPKGEHVNDDSQFIEALAAIEPVLKTASPKIEYLNRTGFLENIVHLYNRGPKFIDYYATPGSRYFPYIVMLIVGLLINMMAIVLSPILIVYEIFIFLTLFIICSIYLSEDLTDLFVLLILGPITLVVFSLGVLRGLALKLLHNF